MSPSLCSYGEVGISETRSVSHDVHGFTLLCVGRCRFWTCHLKMNRSHIWALGCVTPVPTSVHVKLTSGTLCGACVFYVSIKSPSENDVHVTSTSKIRGSCRNVHQASQSSRASVLGSLCSFLRRVTRSPVTCRGSVITWSAEPRTRSGQRRGQNQSGYRPVSVLFLPGSQCVSQSSALFA